MIAAQNNNLELVKLLFEKGALIEERNNREKRAYDIAIESNNYSIAMLLDDLAEYQKKKEMEEEEEEIEDGDNCAICFSSDPEDMVELNACGHVFHYNCIKAW